MCRQGNLKLMPMPTHRNKNKIFPSISCGGTQILVKESYITIPLILFPDSEILTQHAYNLNSVSESVQVISICVVCPHRISFQAAKPLHFFFTLSFQSTWGKPTDPSSRNTGLPHVVRAGLKSMAGKDLVIQSVLLITLP